MRFDVAGGRQERPMTTFEQARFAHWQRLTGVTGIPRSFILARVECDYRAQATVGERLIVRLHVASVGNSSFTFEYEVVNGRTREVVAAARDDYSSRGVAFEYVNVKKNPARLPDMLQHSRGRRAVPVIVEDGVVTIGFDGGT